MEDQFYEIDYRDDDLDIIFKVYIKEVEMYLKDFCIKPNYVNKRLRNENDFYKIKTITKYKPISPIEVFYKVKYEEFMKISNDDEKCSICLDLLYDFDKNWDFSKIKVMNKNLNEKYSVCLLDKCTDHFFHVDCLNNMIGTNNFIKCPVCSKIYGKQTGTQPPGSMSAYILKGTRCQGYDCDTICINYSFPSGSGYSGTHRTAYLPYNKEGTKVLGLLKEAFDRKLIFTIGTSVTTGQTNTTVWAGIHHKTSLNGGTSCFGFPDSTYFNRVQEELASKGVTEDSLDETPEVLARKMIGIGVEYDSNTKYNLNARIVKNNFPIISSKKK